MLMAFCFALDNAGSNIAARMAMIAMTTRSSIKVKPRFIASLNFFKCIFTRSKFLPANQSAKGLESDRFSGGI